MQFDEELAAILFQLANEARLSVIQDLPLFIAAREISFLYHFTSLQNLKSILENGLMGRESLQKLSIEPKLSDFYRNEPIKDGVCFSISAPNNFMASSKLSQGHDLVLLEISNVSEILVEHNFIASPGNFGSKELKRKIQEWPEEFVGGQGLMNMFENQEIRKKYNLAINEPTDPQSEIILLQPLNPKYINRIIAPSSKGYANQDEIRKVSKYLPKNLIIESQNNDIFPEIDSSEYYARSWSHSW